MRACRQQPRQAMLQLATAAAALLVLPTCCASGGGSALLFMVEEPGAGILRAPQKVLYDESLGREELREIHNRAMGRTPRAFEQPLPHVDYFERPEGNLVFMVEGLTGGWHTTYVNQLHREHFHCRIQGVDGLTDVASVYTAGAGEGEEESRHVCLSGNPLLLSKGLCGQARQVDTSKAALDQGLLQGFDKDVELFQPLYPADAYFLSELQSTLQLPATLAMQQDAQADTYLVFSDSLKKLEAAYGRGSNKFATARRVLDKAMGRAVQELSSQRKLLAQIVLTEEAWVNPSTRRQLQAKAATANVTMEEIASTNIITWTAVGLVMVLFMTMTVLLAADSGPKDSLLYARFQADVSGGKLD